MDFNVGPHVRFPFEELSFLNSTRRDIGKMAAQTGFSDTEVARVQLVVTEMATNLEKHTQAKGGQLLAKVMYGVNGQPEGLELLCLDNGPGMTDPMHMLVDGVSTNGSLGQGLGAIKRQSDFFDLYSAPDLGTAVLSRMYRKGKKPKSGQKPEVTFQLGAVSVPTSGETVSGDGWALRFAHQGAFLLVLDGLGHGPAAHLASTQALAAFQELPKTTPVEMLRHVHTQLKKTRGAVGALAHWNTEAGTLAYCGIGNISGRVINPDHPKNLMSYNGTLGMAFPAVVYNQQVAWAYGTILILHSDGLQNRWDLAKYPGLTRHDPTLVAAVLYKDCNRLSDDTLVIVVRATH